MQKCRELSKLPKATKSINVGVFVAHRTSFVDICSFSVSTHNTGKFGQFVWMDSHDPHKTTEVVDPTHPATKLPKSAYKRALPKFLHADIQIHAFPKALLTKPDVRWPNPPYKWAPEVQWSEQLEAIQRASGIERTLSSGLGVKPMKVNTVDMSVACVCREEGHPQKIYNSQNDRPEIKECGLASCDKGCKCTNEWSGQKWGEKATADFKRRRKT